MPSGEPHAGGVAPDALFFRSDMAGPLEQFASLCRTSVSDAIAPKRTDVDALTTRMDKTEQAFAEQIATDDMEMDGPPRSWASRAAGAPAAAASRPLGRVAPTSPPAARAAPAGVNT